MAETRTREQLLKGIEEAIQDLNTDGLAMIEDCFLSVIRNSERYRADTPEERLAEIKAKEKAEIEEKREQNRAREAERAALKGAGKYQLNDTMKKLGHSTYFRLVVPTGKYSTGFEEVLVANRYQLTVEAALDMFGYGMMCGIKEARAGKRGSKNVCEKV